MREIQIYRTNSVTLTLMSIQKMFVWVPYVGYHEQQNLTETWLLKEFNVPFGQ